MEPDDEDDEELDPPEDELLDEDEDDVLPESEDELEDFSDDELFSPLDAPPSEDAFVSAFSELLFPLRESVR
ncbi:hypothetical protein ACXR2U_22355 [Jatrophihabitans sp. YIM 134969]